MIFFPVGLQAFVDALGPGIFNVIHGITSLNRVQSKKYSREYDYDFDYIYFQTSDFSSASTDVGFFSLRLGILQINFVNTTKSGTET